MPSGKVKLWNEEKGFGFIIPEGGGEDIFVHRMVCSKDKTAYLSQGETVNYETKWDEKKGKYVCCSCDGFRTSGGGGGGGGNGGGKFPRKGICREYANGKCTR